MKSSSSPKWATLSTSLLPALLPGLMTLPCALPLSAVSRLSRRQLGFWLLPTVTFHARLVENGLDVSGVGHPRFG